MRDALITHDICTDFCIDGVFDHKAYSEKSLSRMIRAKAKADRAAARLAAAGLSIPIPPTTASIAAPIVAEDSPAPESVPDSQLQQESEDAPPAVPPKEPTPDRTELLRSHLDVVDRYMHLMVPILVDVYAASVITPVRVKTLTGLLKAVSFLDPDELRRVFTVSSICSSDFICSDRFPPVCTGRQFRVFYPVRERLSVTCDWCATTRGTVIDQGSCGVQAYFPS